MDVDLSILTDDHVAEMLAREAKDYSLKYSAMGLEGQRSSRPETKAKPNTRFLQHIIKETKNHNEALLAKEAAEAQSRLERLAEARAREQRKHRPDAKDLRRRQLGDIAATLQGGTKKRKLDDTQHDTPRGRTQRETTRLDKPRESESTRTNQEHEDRKARHRHKDSSRERRKIREKHPREGERSRSRDDRSRHRRKTDRSRSPGHERERGHHHRRRSHHRQRSASPLDERTSRRKHSPHQKCTSSHTQRDHGHKVDRKGALHETRRKEQNRDDESETSDPLEDIIGPLPKAEEPVRRRGRGKGAGPSAMDSRFSDNYDPKTDVQPDSDAADDDWDEALEALRDRQKWKQQGADRLRAAGFTEEQIKSWEKSEGKGGEKSIEDVRWAKPGEGREWDRGKVI